MSLIGEVKRPHVPVCLQPMAYSLFMLSRFVIDLKVAATVAVIIHLLLLPACFVEIVLTPLLCAKSLARCCHHRAS